MTSISFYEARTHLSELLDQVARGKKILITRHGKPAALLVPPRVQSTKDIREVVREMLEFRDREGPTLGGKVTVRDLIEEGRRF
jgi:prevent-host-death family protein